MAGTRRLFEAIIDLLVQIPQSIFRGDWCSGPSLTFQLTSITSASLEPSVRKHQLNRRFHHGIGLDEKPQNYEPIIWGKCGEGGGGKEGVTICNACLISWCLRGSWPRFLREPWLGLLLLRSFHFFCSVRFFCVKLTRRMAVEVPRFIAYRIFHHFSIFSYLSSAISLTNRWRIDYFPLPLSLSLSLFLSIGIYLSIYVSVSACIVW